jgi:hypothetical protein
MYIGCCGNWYGSGYIIPLFIFSKSDLSYWRKGRLPPCFPILYVYSRTLNTPHALRIYPTHSVCCYVTCTCGGWFSLFLFLIFLFLSYFLAGDVTRYTLRTTHYTRRERRRVARLCVCCCLCLL